MTAMSDTGRPPHDGGGEGEQGADDQTTDDQTTDDTPGRPLIMNPPRQPLFSWRRLAIVAMLLAASGFVVAASRAGNDAGEAGADPAIVAYQPAPGGRVLRQSEVGVELEQGYDGRLTIDGVAIPETQMVGAILPGTEAFENLSAEQRTLGPRPNNKNVVRYRPGAGKAVSRFQTGSVEIVVRFWLIAEGPETARSVTYSISVT